MPALKLMSLATAESPDAELLARFTAQRDEAAFEELVRRHGPAVLRVCRRLVGPAAAEDAFQAVFLVLACRAGSVRKAAAVGSWLIGVAGRVARQMRLRSKPVSSLENPDCFPAPSSVTVASHLSLPELAEALDEELTRLPDELRAPVVLCLVEGRTHEQAATELGHSPRTLRRRLDQAKTLLRLRLERRGVVPVVIVALVSSLQTTTALPPDLVQRTMNGVFEFLVGGLAERAAPAILAKGVLSSMTTVKAIVLVPLAACALIGLGAVLAQDKAGKELPNPLREKLAETGQGRDPRTPKEKGQTEPAVQPADQSLAVIEELDSMLAEVKDAAKAKQAHRSPNFLVFAPTPTMARAISAEAEFQRADLAKRWLGKELPPWSQPCEIRYSSEVPTEINFLAASFPVSIEKDGSVRKLPGKIDLYGEFVAVLTHDLPARLHPVVLTSHLGKQLPRWAESGLSTVLTSPKNQTGTDVRCRELLNAGRGIRLRVLFCMTEFPRDMMVLHAQGYSVVRFLLDQKVGPPVLKDIPQVGQLFQADVITEQQIVGFLKLGMEKNTVESWNAAAKAVYGFETVDALEEAWLTSLKTPPRRPDPRAKPTDESAKPKEPETIPPTKLPGAEPKGVSVDEPALGPTPLTLDFTVPIGNGSRVKVPPLGPNPSKPIDETQQDKEQLINFWIGLFASADN